MIDWFRPRAARITFVVTLGASAGCGSGSADGTPGDAGTGGVGGPAAHFVDQLADEMCAAAAQCCPATGHTAPGDCVVRARQQLHESVDPEIAAGAAFNADGASACVAAYRDLAQSCPMVWNSLAACHQALIGTTPPGGPCDRGCAPSTEGEVVCAFSLILSGDTGQTKSPSICQVEVSSPPGGTCDTELTKSILRVCDMAGGSWCFGGLCSVPVAMGGACHGNDCVAGGYCKDRICQPTIAIGQACSGTNGECVPGASCAASSMTCTAGDPWKKLCGGDFN
jgi:hypothetical protein